LGHSKKLTGKLGLIWAQKGERRQVNPLLMGIMYYETALVGAIPPRNAQLNRQFHQVVFGFFQGLFFTVDTQLRLMILHSPKIAFVVMSSFGAAYYN
jgi:hypothetical protein